MSDLAPDIAALFSVLRRGILSKLAEGFVAAYPKEDGAQLFEIEAARNDGSGLSAKLWIRPA